MLYVCITVVYCEIYELGYFLILAFHELLSFKLYACINGLLLQLTEIA